MKHRKSFLSLFWVAGSFASSLPALAQTSAAKAATPIAATAATAVPTLIPYSGTAIADSGKALTGEATITFLLFKDEQAGEPLFTETQAAIIDAAGHYTANLGASLPAGIPVDLFSTGEARWLEVQIAGQKPQPRVLLASVPYALKAADAATLGGLPASAFALAGSNGLLANATSAGITPDATTTVTTTGGTANKLAKFSGGSTVVSSTLYDNGTDVGIGTTSPSATLDVDGTLAVTGSATYNGSMTFLATGTATASKSYNSPALKYYASAYNSSTKAAVVPHFEWQVEPTGNDTATPNGTLNLLATSGNSGIAETGLYLNSSGTIHFAKGQTFPGTGTGTGTITGVTAGTGLTGGGTSGKVTLNLNTGLVPTLAASNTFTGSNTFKSSIYESSDVNIDNTNANTGNVSPGLRFGSASGEGISSKRTSGGNQDGLDFYTGDAARMSISAAGNIGIGTAPMSDSQFSVIGADYAGIFETNNESYSTMYISNASEGDGATTILDVVGYDGSCVIDIYGDLNCNGTIAGSEQASKIDDPQDPANKYLVHASVQSSERMNLYSGNVTTDNLGIATIALPDWFEVENGDFRYQLTTIGQDAHAWVSQKVANKQFKISTNAANVEVSWQITAVRQDGYAKAHPLVAEQEKPVRERGLYQHPEYFGQPREKGMTWSRRPESIRASRAHASVAKSVTPTP